MLKPLANFTVMGEAVGKGRPKFARRGNFVTAYTPAKTKDYEALVQEAATKAMGVRKPCAGAIQLNLDVKVAIPKSWSKIKRESALKNTIYPLTKPDSSNILKGIEDAMNDIVFVDDSQIVNLSVTKRYSDKPRVEIRVYEVIYDAKKDLL